MKDILDRLAYLKQVAFFRNDAYNKMLKIGISKLDAYCITSAESFKNADIIQWWTDYGDEFGDEMLKYLETF